MPTPPRRAAIYCRISRDRTGGGLGVARQEGDCRELAERLDCDVIGEPFVDNDLSAYSGKPRPAYRRLLAAITTGQVDVVLSWHTDRLHRSPAELEAWIDACQPRGVEVHTVKAGPVDLATPAGRMQARTYGAVARYESEHRSERVAAKMDEIAKAGGFMGGVRPFGYTADGMELVPREAALIAEGTRKILAGDSLRSVVALFNDSGLTSTKAGKAWTAVAVRELLLRERNAGLLRHRGKVVGDAQWEKIVEPDEWRAVRELLDDPGRRTSPGNQPRWLGSGLYACGVCAETLIDGVPLFGPMVVGTAGRHRDPSYTCRAYRERRGSRHVTRVAPVLDDYVSRVLVARLSLPDARDVFARPTVAPEEVAALRAEVATQEAKRLGLAVERADEKITEAQFAVLNGRARERQEAAEARLATATVQGATAGIVTSADVAATWKAAPLDTRRAVLAELVTVTVLPAARGRRPGGGYFDPDTVDIDWKADQ